jgi:hypothetical protein
MLAPTRPRSRTGSNRDHPIDGRIFSSYEARLKAIARKAPGGSLCALLADALLIA